jgi:bacteriocin biosynthesis cyclodehydratase domain-containing protein
VLPHDGRLASVGPLVVPDETCCYECLLRRRAANVEWGEDLADVQEAPLAARAGASLELLLSTVAAHIALRWLVGHDTSVAGVLYALDVMPALTLTEHPVLRVPRCPVCSPVERRAAPLPWHGAEAA